MNIQKPRIIVFFAFFLVLLGLRPASANQNETVKIFVDTTTPGKPLKHVWQYYGYDECNYTTSSGARKLMKTLANINPEPVYLRQHFLLTSGDGKPSLKWGSTNTYTEDAAGNPVYDWHGIEVTHWQFESTTSTAVNLFPDGTISTDYLLTKAA